MTAVATTTAVPVRPVAATAELVTDEATGLAVVALALDGIRATPENVAARAAYFRAIAEAEA